MAAFLRVVGRGPYEIPNGCTTSFFVIALRCVDAPFVSRLAAGYPVHEELMP
jgi:hypothetical protein